MFRILYIDDDIADLVLLCHQLKDDPIEIHWVKSVYDAETLLESNAIKFDLVVSDVCGTSMPFHNKEPLEQIRDLPHKEEIIVTSTIQIPFADCIDKDNVAELIRNKLKEMK